jgi:hypothetical protein
MEDEIVLESFQQSELQFDLEYGTAQITGGRPHQEDEFAVLQKTFSTSGKAKVSKECLYL